MKRIFSVITIIIWFSFSAFFSIFNQSSAEKVYSSERESSKSLTQADKTAAEAYKNIQVLKDIPASELIPTMIFMRNSLGVACSHCHVSGKFEAEDKQTKQTARKMLRMVSDINKNSFITNVKVNCNTCHRGQEKPDSAINIPRDMTVSSSKTANQNKTPSSTVEQILDDYVKAIGGREAIEKLSSRVMTGTVTTSRGDTAKLTIYQSPPNKKLDIREYSQATIANGYDGNTGWRQIAGKKHTEKTGEDLLRAERDSEYFMPLKLKEMYSEMKLLGVEKLANNDAFVIEAIPPFENTRERLYFDVETGLLLRILMLTDSHFGKNPQATDFGDYRKVNGVKMPFLIKITLPDINVTQKFDRIKHIGRIEVTKFKPTVEGS